MQSLIHFFHLIRPYWFHPRQWLAWLLLATVIGFGLVIVQVSVAINRWNKDFYDALTQFETEKILPLSLQYLLYMAIIVLFVALGSWLLVIRWRSHLTAQLTEQWLQQHGQYRLTLNSELDNPDQRIAEDVALLAEKSIDLIRYFFSNMAKLVAFIGVLWMMSGVQQITLLRQQWQIHGYLVCLALVYTLICSLLTHLIGRKLKPLNVQKQKVEADYRSNLIRVRENAEQIAFAHGEQWEKAHLHQRFHAIRQNWHKLMNREFKLECFTASYLRITHILPIFAVLPLYLAKAMSFGDMMQARSAFSSVQDGFGWFMDFYKRIMEWAATVQRLWEFQQSIETLDPIPPTQKRQTDFVCQNLTVHLPGQKHRQNPPLFAPVSFHLNAGEWLHLTGKSGLGKSSLLRVIGGLWQSYQGEFRLPQGRSLFLAQKSYFPPGTLEQILCYPEAAFINDTEIQQLLTLVGLPHLSTMLQEEKDWQKILSGGEQQRLNFARALLLKPNLLCLDESTNQLDLPSAIGLLTFLQQRLPHTIVIGVTHQAELNPLFDRVYALKA